MTKKICDLSYSAARLTLFFFFLFFHFAVCSFCNPAEYGTRFIPNRVKKKTRYRTHRVTTVGECRNVLGPVIAVPTITVFGLDLAAKLTV